MGRNLVTLAIVLFAVSWFVPVVKDQRFWGEGIPGWEACRVAWEMLRSPRFWLIGGPRILLGLTCLTNGAMVLAALLKSRGRNPALGAALLGCAALNLGWLYHNTGLRADLRAGYYLWTGSFAVAGFGFLSASWPLGSPARGRHAD